MRYDILKIMVFSYITPDIESVWENHDFTMSFLMIYNCHDFETRRGYCRHPYLQINTIFRLLGTMVMFAHETIKIMKGLHTKLKETYRFAHNN